MIRFWAPLASRLRKRRVAVALIEIPAGRDGADVKGILLPFHMRQPDW
jgi:hypothetical protein